MRSVSENLRGQRGISMVEVMAAIMIISIAVIALLVARNNNLARMVDEQSRFQASRLAEKTLNEALVLIRTGSKKAADYDSESGSLEEEGLRWTFEISDVEITEIFDDENSETLEGVALLTIRVYYKSGAEERSVQYSSVVRIDETEKK